MQRLDPDTLALIGSFVTRYTQSRETHMRDRMRRELILIVIPRALDYYRSGSWFRRVWRALRG